MKNLNEVYPLNSLILADKEMKNISGGDVTGCQAHQDLCGGGICMITIDPNSTPTSLGTTAAKELSGPVMVSGRCKPGLWGLCRS